jgi:hypothetical protein
LIDRLVMAKVVRGHNIEEITNAKELPELHLTQSEIAAIKLSYMELVAKVTVDPLTGEEEDGFDRVTKKAYKIDPGFTKMLFGAEATRKFEIDERTGVRKKAAQNQDTLRDDLAAIDASLKATVNNGGARARTDTQNAPAADPAEKGLLQQFAPAPGAVAANPAPAPAKAMAKKRAASRPRKAPATTNTTKSQPLGDPSPELEVTSSSAPLLGTSTTPSSAISSSTTTTGPGSSTTTRPPLERVVSL